MLVSVGRELLRFATMETRQKILLGLLALAIPLSGCSEQPPAQSARQRPEATAAAALDYPGILQGQVVFDGPQIVESTLIANTTDPQHCGTVQSLHNRIISEPNRGIKNAIVALLDVPLPADYQVPPSHLTIDNRNCQFQPRVTVLTTGSSIEVVNSDPVVHTVHLYGPFNLNASLGPGQSRALGTVKRVGTIAIKCDFHGWMQAFVGVDDHPFHAVSDVDGGFRIHSIPPGSYQLQAWHEAFGTKRVHVEIGADAPAQVTVQYGAESP